MESEEGLDCPVCFEQYDSAQRTPKMMPCLHTVCATCILDLISSTYPSISTTQTNQTPRRATSVPDGHIYGEVPLQEDSTDQTTRTPSRPSSVEDHIYEDLIFQEPTRTSTNSTTRTSTNSTSRPLSFLRPSANISAISAVAQLLRNNPRHPPLRRLSGSAGRGSSDEPRVPERARNSDTPPQLPSRRSGLIKPPPPVRPKSKPPVPPPTPPPSGPKEPAIPKEKTVSCPLCRADINTSTLQTNRYVLAHMRDLARLRETCSSDSPPLPTRSNPTPQPSAPTPQFQPEDFWCIACNSPAMEGCSSHDVSPVDKWLETLEASKGELQRTLEERLGTHMKTLEDTESVVKVVFHALTKASKQVWDERQASEKAKEELASLQETSQTAEDVFEVVSNLNAKLDSLREFETRLTDLENGISSNEVFLWRQNDKLFISTQVPDRTVIISVIEGQRHA